MAVRAARRPPCTALILNIMQEPTATAAQLTGVTADSVGGLTVLASALAINLVAVVCFLVFHGAARLKYPQVYCGASVCGASPWAPATADVYFGWIWATLRMPLDEVCEKSGLDSAMFIEFTHLSMKILAVISLPMVGVLCPLHYFCGDVAARDDHLSRLGILEGAKGVPRNWGCK